jgi:hypothetical protein
MRVCPHTTYKNQVCVHTYFRNLKYAKIPYSLWDTNMGDKCLKSIETSSQLDQQSQRAYGDCWCGGKGGKGGIWVTGDWRTYSPLGACWFEPAEKGCTKETRLQVLDLIRQENQKLFGIILTGVPRTCCVWNTCGGTGAIGARSPGGRAIAPDVARYLVSSSNLLAIACCDRKYSCCWARSCASWSASCWRRACSSASSTYNI